MPDPVKQEALRAARAFGAAALAIAATGAYGFVGGWKQYGTLDVALVMVLFGMAFPIWVVTGGFGFWFGWRPRGRNASAVFLALCLLPRSLRQSPRRDILMSDGSLAVADFLDQHAQRRGISGQKTSS